MRIAVIGLGLIGMQRLRALVQISNESSLLFNIFVFDTDINKKKLIKDNPLIVFVNSLQDINSFDMDWMFICTPHFVTTSYLCDHKLNARKIFVEKPLGRSLEECKLIVNSNNYREKIAVGFNYRFYPGIKALIHDVIKKKFGDIISVNMTLGHGNSPGMQNSWKLNQNDCGGGSLLDPGVHLLDLASLISVGKLSVVGGKYWTGFWNTGIEEETHLLLVDESSCIFNIQVSLNRWRSSFKLEVNGVNGYGIVEGRGKSYGPQSYRVGKRWAWLDGRKQSDTEN